MACERCCELDGELSRLRGVSKGWVVANQSLVASYEQVRAERDAQNKVQFALERRVRDLETHIASQDRQLCRLRDAEAALRQCRAEKEDVEVRERSARAKIRQVEASLAAVEMQPEIAARAEALKKENADLKARVKTLERQLHLERRPRQEETPLQQPPPPPSSSSSSSSSSLLVPPSSIVMVNAEVQRLNELLRISEADKQRVRSEIREHRRWVSEKAAGVERVVKERNALRRELRQLRQEVNDRTEENEVKATEVTKVKREEGGADTERANRRKRREAALKRKAHTIEDKNKKNKKSKEKKRKQKETDDDDDSVGVSSVFEELRVLFTGMEAPLHADSRSLQRTRMRLSLVRS